MAAYGEGAYGLGLYGVGVSPSPEDSLGTPPLTGATPWERAAFQGGARPIARLTVESGGGDPVELVLDQEVTPEVTRTITRGTHWTASATVIRQPGQDTEARVTTDGAIFRLHHGWDYGGGRTELRPFGVFQLAKMPTLDREEPLKLELQDRWAQFSDCEAIEEVIISAGTDPAVAIGQLVHQVDPTIEVVINATGALLEEDVAGLNRAEMATQIAQAASIYPHFDAEGRMVIDPAPTQRAPVASLSDGANATLTRVTTESVFTIPYNCVVIEDDGVPLIVLHVADPAHPRHRDQPGMGLRPYRKQAPVAMNDQALRALAESLLAQLVGGVQRRTFSTWGRGDLNPGDWVAVLEAGTYLIPARSSVSMVEEIRHNPLTVGTEIVTRSVPRILTEEG